ncbi:unnamed protein product [Protopolystoma xenopodis]|uniref:Uncharacterized protein n=1 Tax=Protopolystoma xenopodis TaxID=117903 RepID=A0A3S5CDV9_9PLAT|nr:unnamed protein product [Protopolystoma xenopodis]
MYVQWICLGPFWRIQSLLFESRRPGCSVVPRMRNLSARRSSSSGLVCLAGRKRGDSAHILSVCQACHDCLFARRRPLPWIRRNDQSRRDESQLQTSRTDGGVECHLNDWVGRQKTRFYASPRGSAWEAGRGREESLFYRCPCVAIPCPSGPSENVVSELGRAYRLIGAECGGKHSSDRAGVQSRSRGCELASLPPQSTNSALWTPDSAHLETHMPSSARAFKTCPSEGTTGREFAARSRPFTTSVLSVMQEGSLAFWYEPYFDAALLLLFGSPDAF